MKRNYIQAINMSNPVPVRTTDIGNEKGVESRNLDPFGEQSKSKSFPVDKKFREDPQ